MAESGPMPGGRAGGPDALAGELRHLCDPLARWGKGASPPDQRCTRVVLRAAHAQRRKQQAEALMILEFMILVAYSIFGLSNQGTA